MGLEVQRSPGIKVGFHYFSATLPTFMHFQTGSGGTAFKLVLQD